MEKKKPFRETKAGKFLNEKVPHVLNLIGDVLPEKGGLGIIKNIISSDPKIPEPIKSEALLKLQELELELEKLEQADRANARLREIEMAKTGRHDWLMYVVGGIILTAFAIVVYASVFMALHGETFVRISTMVETLTVAIVSYYFGSSKSSSDKTKLLKS